MSQFTFNISLSVLNHLGRNLYRSFITVLGEAISNSWDADAIKIYPKNYLIVSYKLAKKLGLTKPTEWILFGNCTENGKLILFISLAYIHYKNKIFYFRSKKQKNVRTFAMSKQATV